MKFISIRPENNNASQFIDITQQMPSFVKLYSPNCGHCVAMQESWDKLKHSNALNKYDMAIIEVHADELSKINSPAVSVNGGLPTIRKVFKNGTLGNDYNGDRTTDDMVNFITREFKEALNKRSNNIHNKTSKVGKKSRLGKKSRVGRKHKKTKRRNKTLRSSRK